MSDRLLKESDVIEAFKGRDSLIHDAYTAVAIIRSVPSANRPQGEWVKGQKGDIICSVCGESEANFIFGWDYEYEGISKYCPNCGARMKGADDE